LFDEGDPHSRAKIGALKAACEVPTRHLQLGEGHLLPAAGDDSHAIRRLGGQVREQARRAIRWAPPYGVHHTPHDARGTSRPGSGMKPTGMHVVPTMKTSKLNMASATAGSWLGVRCLVICMCSQPVVGLRLKFTGTGAMREASQGCIWSSR